MIEPLSHKHLLDVLQYDRETGEFRWKRRSDVSRRANLRWAGKIAGSLRDDGYWHIRIDGRRYMRHRLAWLYVNGKWPPDQIDHINRVRGDDKIANLRAVSRKENMLNMGMFVTNSTGYTGVHWHRDNKNWIAQISINNRRTHLGCFDAPEKAHAAYVKALRERRESLASGPLND